VAEDMNPVTDAPRRNTARRPVLARDSENLVQRTVAENRAALQVDAFATVAAELEALHGKTPAAIPHGTCSVY